MIHGFGRKVVVMKKVNPYASPRHSGASAGRRRISVLTTSCTRNVLAAQVAAGFLCVIQGRAGWFFVESMVVALAVSILAFPVIVAVVAFRSLGLSSGMTCVLFSIALSALQWWALLPTFS